MRKMFIEKEIHISFKVDIFSKDPKRLTKFPNFIWRSLRISTKSVDFFQIWGAFSEYLVSAETILFWKYKMWKFSYSFRIVAIFYFINWIVAAETIKGRKLFKWGNYSRKYGNMFKLQSDKFPVNRASKWDNFKWKSL